MLTWNQTQRNTLDLDTQLWLTKGLSYRQLGEVRRGESECGSQPLSRTALTCGDECFKVHSLSLVNTNYLCQAFACSVITNQTGIMDIVDIRRARLGLWFSDKPLPKREKSYLSQLINGVGSFGEKAARRLEEDYRMPPKYLDTPLEDELPPPPVDAMTAKLLTVWDRLLPGQQAETLADMTEKSVYAESIRQQVRAEEASKTKLHVVKVGGDEKEKQAPQQPKKQPGRVQLKDRVPEEEPTYITRLITRAEADRRKLAIAVEHDRRQAERDRRQLETEDQTEDQDDE